MKIKCLTFKFIIMKKFLFATATVLLMSASVLAHAKSEAIDLRKEGNDVEKISKKNDEVLEKIRVVIHLKWGRVSRDCQGFGICSADIDVVYERKEFIGTTDGNGNFVLEITPDGLKSIEKYLGGPVLILDEDFALPVSLTKKLELKTGYKLKAGKYKIQTGKAISSITFI